MATNKKKQGIWKRFKRYSAFQIKHMDRWVIGLSLALFGLGVLMIFRITQIVIFNNPAFLGAQDYMWQQVRLGGAGVVVMFALIFIPHKWIRSLGWLAILATIGLLFATLVFGVDGNDSDVRRWLYIGTFRFQPGEFARLGLIYSVAWLVYVFTKAKTFYVKDKKKLLRFLMSERVPSHRKRKYLLGSWLSVFLFIGVVFLLFFRQPDLGSAITVVGVGMVMLLCSGLPGKHIAFFLGMALVGGLLVFNFPHLIVGGYQYERFEIWRDPFNHPRGLQNYYGFRSIALGGLTGVGLGESVQVFGFAIEAHTDFIITIIAEEFGLLTVLAIMGAYFGIAASCFRAALKGKDLFTSMFAIGTGALFLVQPMINLGGVSGLIPLTGITLPLLSFGGTSAFAIFLMVGVYLNCRIEIVRDNLLEKVAQKKKKEATAKILKFQKAS